ncbi:MAG: site-specific integrase [Kaiparowitsia implicata GSE-PSE-MK54-09C]|jgi:integrase|nr:site-specific integrase [Kaiparowitsia implicata GSE-PSE-MK54-09C]
MKDIMAGKTRANVKTDKLRGRAIVRGGAGTAARTVGLFGGILTYAVELGIIEQNPVHGVRKPKDQVNARRLSEQEYRTLGDILRKAIKDWQYETTAEIIRVIALTGCRRSEIIGLQCGEVDTEGSCLRLTDSKEGASVRPIGLPALEYLESRRNEDQDAEAYVFPGWEDDTPFGAFPRQWTKLFKDTDLAGITPHVLRHSFASIGNDDGFTEATIAALVGHSRGTITSRYIHTFDTALIMAADSIAGYIQGLLDGVAFTHTPYALDRDSRKSALAHFLGKPTPRGGTPSDQQRSRSSASRPPFSR